MATPINSNANQAQSASPLASELLARMQGNAQGDAGGAGAFNAWMERHTLTPDSLQAEAPKGPAAKAAEPAPSRDASSTASRLLEQALARSRQQAVAAARQSEQSAQAASSASRAAPAKAERNDKVKDKSSEADNEDDGVDGAEQKAAAPEDSALVQELTPPPDVKTDDAASMMAWLASLTHADPTHGKKLPTQTAATEDTAGATADRGQSTDTSRADLSSLTGLGGHGRLNDSPVWQAVQPTTALLQAEAGAAAQGAFKQELSQHTGADPISAAGGALALRPGGLQAEATAVPHESATLQAPLGGTDFAQALSDQLTMWIKGVPDDGQMTAELHLNPADMGPIHVKISLEGQDAHVDFAAAAVETRQAIEASMNLLSTALSDVGLNLTGGDVSAQTSQQGFQSGGESGGQRQDSGGASRASFGADSGDTGAPARAVRAPRPGAAGGLDLYA